MMTPQTSTSFLISSYRPTLSPAGSSLSFSPVPSKMSSTVEVEQAAVEGGKKPTSEEEKNLAVEKEKYLASGRDGIGINLEGMEQDMNEGRPPVENGGVLWSDGMDLLKDAAERKHFLPTGLEGIDTLLGGGLRKGQLTEITGQSSSGKTQACLYSASHVAARHMGAVLYLDTSNSFSPSRIARILDELPGSLIKEPKDVRLKRVMSSMICESVFDIFALFEVLDQLEVSLNDKVNNGGNKICLLIIDSISSLLAPIIGGKYSQGRSMMISVAMILKKLADKHNLSVLVTNHMVAGNGAPKPALGESWKAVPHIRLMISRDRGSNICTATILKHTLLASGRHMKFAVPG